MGLGHRSAAPVRLTRRLLVQRRVHDRLNLLRRDRRLAAPPLANHADPFRPSVANRSRQLLTVVGETPRSAPIRVFATPSAASSNARARCTSRCFAVCDRASFSSTSRWPSASGIAAVGERIPHPAPQTSPICEHITTSYATTGVGPGFGSVAFGSGAAAGASLGASCAAADALARVWAPIAPPTPVSSAASAQPGPLRSIPRA